MDRTVRHCGGLLLTLIAVALWVMPTVRPWVTQVEAADHRESPVMDEDPAADITDIFAFVSPSDASKAVLAMNVNPFAVPAENPSYSFSPDVLYQFKIDNNGDGREDLVIQARFEGFETARDSRCPPNASGQGGQFVTVRGPVRPHQTGAQNHDLGDEGPAVTGCSNTVIGPSADGIRVFAGLRDDPFVFDVGQFFRILRGAQDVFRGFMSPALGPLRGRLIRANGTSGVDGFGGFNVSTLAIEVPKSLIQGTAHRAGTYLQNDTTVGIWGTTSRRRETERSPKQDAEDEGPFVQIERMGQQVFKTVFIPAGHMRDVFNRAVPRDDVTDFGQFVPDALTTADNDGTGNTIAGRIVVLGAAGVAGLPNGAPLLIPSPAGFPNTDRHLLREALLPDVLRLNLALAANDLAIGANGLQNGRRPGDAVADIALQLLRQLADVKFPGGSGFPGSGPVGSRKALDCSALPCPDRRVFVVLQGTDFIKPDAELLMLDHSGNDRSLPGTFPFFAAPHPLPGEAGTVGFPAQQ